MYQIYNVASTAILAEVWRYFLARSIKEAIAKTQSTN